MSDAKRWFVVKTHANGEFKALAHILRQGFDGYLPRYIKRRRHAHTRRNSNNGKRNC